MKNFYGKISEGINEVFGLANSEQVQVTHSQQLIQSKMISNASLPEFQHNYNTPPNHNTSENVDKNSKINFSMQKRYISSTIHEKYITILLPQ